MKSKLGVLSRQVASDLYSDGWSIRKLADYFGYSYGGMHRLLRGQGIEFRKRGGNYKREGNLRKK